MIQNFPQVGDIKRFATPPTATSSDERFYTRVGCLSRFGIAPHRKTDEDLRMHAPPPPTGRILAYGLDRALLETRQMLLVEAGLDADSVETAEEFRHSVEMAAIPYSLFVLCHTVSPEEQMSISAEAAQSNTLVYGLHSSVQPPEFLRRVSELLFGP